MSGFCSKHQGHDPSCSICTSVPLTEREQAYYEGWDEHLKSIHRNGWSCTENIVLDAYDRLEKAVRDLLGAGPANPVETAIAELDELRRLNRGFRE